MYVNGKVVYITGGLVFIALMAVPGLYIYCSTPAPVRVSVPAVESPAMEETVEPVTATELTVTTSTAPGGNAGYGAGTSANAGAASATAPRRAEGL